MTDKNQIHPSAVIHEKAQIGSGVTIGPFCIVGAHVGLGDNVTLHAHVVVDGHTSIGEGTQVFPFAAIGTPPQDLKYHGEPSRLIIGKNNRIREHVTMHPGTEGGGMETVIGDNGLFMVGVHVAHDCRIGNNVIMANNATLGGHVRIGEHAMIGGMSGVENDVIPYGRVKGERAHLAGLNLVGLERRGYEKGQVKTLQKAFKTLFAEEGTLEERLENVAAEFSSEPVVMDLVRFAREKTRFPLCHPPRKAA